MGRWEVGADKSGILTCIDDFRGLFSDIKVVPWVRGDATR